MKFCQWIVCVFVMARLGAMGQVTVEVISDKDQFLPGESVLVGVRISNLSGQTLHLGADDSWVDLIVDAPDGFIVPKIADVPAKGEFDVASSTRVTRRFDLTPSFRLTRPGPYTVKAVLKVDAWGKSFPSPVKKFEIAISSKIWEQEFGVPPVAGAAAGPPEVRRYALQQAIHTKKMQLYARITDAGESRIYGVYPIGPLLSFSKPEAQVDSASVLHVLWQTGAREFTYVRIEPNGALIRREHHEYTNTRPTLKPNSAGVIGVVGGARKPAVDDLPPSMEEAARPAGDASTPARKTP